MKKDQIKLFLSGISKISDIFLFGSTAHDQSTEKSDIDLAISCKKGTASTIIDKLKMLSMKNDMMISCNKGYSSFSIEKKLFDINIFEEGTVEHYDFFHFNHPVIIKL